MEDSALLCACDRPLGELAGLLAGVVPGFSPVRAARLLSRVSKDGSAVHRHSAGAPGYRECAVPDSRRPPEPNEHRRLACRSRPAALRQSLETRLAEMRAGQPKDPERI